MKVIVKHNIFLEDNKEYTVCCFDGYAYADRLYYKDKKPKTVKLKYPKLQEVLADPDMAYEVLKYNGLYDLKPSDLNYGDIMMCYGKPIKEYENS